MRVGAATLLRLDQASKTEPNSRENLRNQRDCPAFLRELQVQTGVMLKRKHLICAADVFAL